MRLKPVLLMAAALLIAGAAHAQLSPISLRLNTPIPAGQYFTVLDKTGLQGNSQYTLEAWVYPTSYTGFPTILGNNYASSYWLGLNTTGHVRFYPRGTGLATLESAAIIPLNRWTHVAATYDAVAGAKLYVNASLDASTAAITGAPGTDAGDLRIGADREGGSPSYFWQGNLDEIRIWNVVRTPAQIRATEFVDPGRPFFFAPGYAGLKADWDGFTAGSGTNLFDTGAGVAEIQNPAAPVGGTTSGMLTVAQGTPMSYNVAVELNGIDDCAHLSMGDGFAAGVSISAWIAPYDFPGFQTIAGRDYNTSFWFGITPDRRLRMWPRGGTGFVESAPVVVANHWQHVEATYDGTTTRFYWNGRLVSSSTAQSGAIAENGTTVWVGADHEGATGAYFFHGLMDEVRVFPGVESDAQVRERMWIGWAYDTAFMTDRDGVSRLAFDAHFDGTDATTVVGSGARYVRSGASMTSAFAPSPHLEDYASSVLGGLASVPEDSSSSSLGTELHIEWDQPISSMKVFVMAPIHDLSHTNVRLRSPLGATIDLMLPGAAVGRDLHTVFDDGATLTLATGSSPYLDGVRPSDPLSTFNGLSSQGNWRLEIIGSTTPARVGLWAWGLKINNAPLGVEGAARPHVALTNRGPNPARDHGALEFSVPAAAHVELAMFDVSGRLVAELYRGAADAGVTRVQWQAKRLPPGLYLARLVVDGETRAQLRIVIAR